MYNPKETSKNIALIMMFLMAGVLPVLSIESKHIPIINTAHMEGKPFVMTVHMFDSVEELNEVYRSKGGKKPKVYAFSVWNTVKKDGQNFCSVWIVRPKSFSQKVSLEHEVKHCMFGIGHPNSD